MVFPRNMRSAVAAALCALLAPLAPGAGAEEAGLPLDQIKLPPGFVIETYATGLANARSLARSDRGTLFVGTRTEGKVYAVVDEDGDGKADKTHVIAEGLHMPNGVAFRDGSLYVAEVSQVRRYDRIEEHLADPPEAVIINESFPNEEHHGWKYLAFGPDGMLYLQVGAPCNICEFEDRDERFATIIRMNADGSNPEVFMRGVRNSLGCDWRPGTQEFWFTDNGRDNLGDDVPFEELNRAAKPGLHFGFPYCYDDGVADPDIPAGKDCAQFEKPALKLTPHCVALGMKFYTGKQFPEDYRNQILIAEHGSSNRTPQAGPTGYRIALVRLDAAGNPAGYEDFATGWMQADGQAWGRPVDLLILPDGALLVSDDKAGAVYRISWKV